MSSGIRTEKSWVRTAIARAFKEDISAHSEATGDTEDDLAEALGQAKSYLNNMANAHCPVSGEVAVNMCRRTGQDRSIRELCRLAGLHAVSVKEHGAEITVLKMIQDYTSAAAHASALLDHERILPHEYEQCERDLDEAIEAALRLKVFLRKESAKKQSGGRTRTLAETVAL